MDYRLQNVLFIDIETVALTKTYRELNPDLKKHWERKSGFLRNIETEDPEELYYRKAGIYAEFGKVITAALGLFHEIDGVLKFRLKSITSHDESQLLVNLKELLENRFDPETLRLCAHNGKEFDFPYLSRRMLIHGIRLPYVLDNAGKKPWEVNFLDTLEMWKFGDRKNYTSLDLLTSIFNIPSSKTDLDGSKVNETYYSEEGGLKRIEQYCQGDVLATARLYLKMNAMDLIKDENITTIV